MKLSFKNDPTITGLARVVDTAGTVIKGDGKQVGNIRRDRDYKWVVMFSVKKVSTKEEPSPFKNITLKFRGESRDAARQFVTEKWNSICSKFDLYQFED